MNEYRGHCDCCGGESRTAIGFLSRGDTAVGTYRVRWTVGPLHDPGATIDLMLGAWGEEAGPDRHSAVAKIDRLTDDGTPSLMVVDADSRPAGDDTFAATALRRDDAIGTPLAAQVFTLIA